MNSAFYLLAALVPFFHPQEPDVAVYGNIVVDRVLEKESTTVSTTMLKDCSTTELNCVNGQIFQIAVPRQCRAFIVGETFVSGDVQSRVLKTYPANETRALGPAYGRHSEAGLGSTPLTLLGDPDRRWVVYVFDHNGLIALYYDSRKTSDLFDLVEREGLIGLRNAGQNYDHYLFEIETIRPILQCETRQRQQPDPNDQG